MVDSSISQVHISSHGTVVKHLHLNLNIWVMLVSITCHIIQEKNLFAYTQRKLLLIKLILKRIIQWWINPSLKCIIHHMETIFKLLTLQVKVWVLIVSLLLYLPLEKNLLCSQRSRIRKLATIRLG